MAEEGEEEEEKEAGEGSDDGEDRGSGEPSSSAPSPAALADAGAALGGVVFRAGNYLVREPGGTFGGGIRARERECEGATFFFFISFSPKNKKK